MVHESTEANNILMAAGTLAVGVPPLPNLAPLESTFSPNVVNVDAGELLTVTEEVENNGAVASGSFRVGVYLSTNSVVTPSDVLIHSRTITAMSPGSSSGSTADVQLPTGLSDGSYYIGVFVDDLAQQGELSEGDNVLVATGTLDVVSSPDPEPDLIMEQCDYNGNKKAPGDSFQVVTKVTNEGDLSAQPFHVGIYLSTDNVISPDDVLLGERNLIAGLSAGFSNVSSAPVTIPPGQPEGTYYVGAYADNKLVIAESEEDDNDYTTPGVLIVEFPPPPAPELFVKSASHDGGTHDPGDVITIDDEIKNKGELDAGPFRVGYYLSDDGVIDTTDTLLATRVITSLLVDGEGCRADPRHDPARHSARDLPARHPRRRPGGRHRERRGRQRQEARPEHHRPMKRLLPIPMLVLVLSVSGGTERSAPRPALDWSAHPAAIVGRLDRLTPEGETLDLWAPLTAVEAAGLEAYREPARLPTERHEPPPRRSDYVDLHHRSQPLGVRKPVLPRR